MFAEEFKLSFPKPAEGEASSIYVNDHHIYLCNNQNWDKNTKRSWIKFHLNEDKGSKVNCRWWFSMVCDYSCKGKS